MQHEHEEDVMRRSRILAIGAVLIFSLHGAVWSADLTEGFSGLKWGTDIGETRNLIRVGSNADIDYYINPEVVHTIGDIRISQVIYGFFKQRLFAAYVHIENLKVFSRIKEALQTRYGVPKVVYNERGEPSIYRWKTEKIKIKLKVDSTGGKMKTAFYYIPLSGRVNEESEEAFRENKIRFLPIERGKTPKRLPLLEF
jgi:hypothetical protein